MCQRKQKSTIFSNQYLHHGKVDDSNNTQKKGKYKTLTHNIGCYSIEFSPTYVIYYPAI